MGNCFSESLNKIENPSPITCLKEKKNKKHLDLVENYYIIVV